MQRRLVHRGDQKLVVQAEDDAEMRARPFQNLRIGRHIGKPQRHAVVMRDREPHAFRRERKPADRRRRIEEFLLALAAADKGGLAGRPRHRAIGMQRDIVDPASFCVGREQRDLALIVQCNELAVIAAHNDALAVRCRAENPSAVDGDRRNLAVRSNHRNAFLGADKGRALAEEMHRGDGHAERDRMHPVGDGYDGGGAIAGVEFFHHVVIQRSKPSRMTCSGSSRPMKTSRLSRGSPSFQARW